MLVKGRLGMSMVETIASFLLLTLIVLGVLNLFPGALLANRRSELALQAETAADQVLESTRAQGFASLKLGKSPQEKLVINGYDYLTQLEVAKVSGKDPVSIRSLKVTVNWTVAGRQHTLLREVWVSSVHS